MFFKRNQKDERTPPKSHYGAVAPEGKNKEKNSESSPVKGDAKSLSKNLDINPASGIK